MLCAMDARKRPRFELINVGNNNSNDDMQGVASSADCLGTATLATIGGQSFILSNSPTSPIPANILLSICEENSNGTAAEYILDHSILAPIKEEQTIAGQTNNNTSQLQQTAAVAVTPQYRIVNQAGEILSTSCFNPTIINSGTIDANSLNSLNLPPGCEIYVIKEVFDSPKQIIGESNTTSPCTKTISVEASNIKRKRTSSVPPQRRLIHDNSSTRNLSHNSTFSINSSSPVPTTSSVPTSTPDDTTKRSVILEAYKNRDDQRRATHNEVERRRRDKLNSLIYKLKEMLPIEQVSSKHPRSAASSNSKMQILINACEYIKSMQEEMDFLRECLAENEDLRLKNESLQEEINSLRSKQQRQNGNNVLLTSNANHNSSNSDNNSDNSDSCEITLNSLNSNYANVQLFNSSTHHHLVDLVGSTITNGTLSATNPVNGKYAKRELIITDYVD